MEFNGQKNVDDVFKDFKGRRIAMVKALTDEADNFFQKCDPEKENVCLYGYPNGSWEVALPIEEVPAEFPEPVIGINFARDDMERNSWLSLIAIHCDCWLKALAFFFGAHFGFDKNDRKRLFQMINDMPTVYEVVNMKTKEQTGNPKSNKGQTAKKAPHKSGQLKVVQMPKEDVKREDQKGGDDDGQGSTFCGACGFDYADDSTENEFWICCDLCERWFHGKCVNITPKRALKINEYVCRTCSNKRAKV